MMRIPSCLYVAVLGAASIFGAGCQAANEKPSCDSALKSLKSSIEQVKAGARARAEMESLGRFAKEARAACNVSQFDVGMRLIEGYKELGNQESIAELFEQLRPTSAKEREVLHFRAAEFFIDTGDRKKALFHIDALASVSSDIDLRDTVTAEYECEYGRCAFALSKLQRLSDKFPDIDGYRMLLGFALADRHEFDSAARQFEVVLRNGSMDVFSSKAAVVATTAFANSGQPQKARRFYELYSTIDQPVNGVSDRNFAMMEKIANDTTGQVFIFSEWPVPESSAALPLR